MSAKGKELLENLLTIREKTWSGRGKYKPPIEPNTDNLPAIPDDWTWASTDQLTAFVTDGEHQTPQRSDDGVLLLSARNVQNGRLDFKKVDYVPEAEYQRISKRLVVQEGDVLLSCSGTVGRTCVAPSSPRFTLVRSVAVLRPLEEMGKFMSYALQSPFLQSQIDEKKTQTAQANIFQGKIKTLTLPLPPLPEQRRIVARIEELFSRLDAGVAALRHAKAQLQRYRQSVLAAAVTGQLTREWREQHPDTEPASELLERILEQRREQWKGRGKFRDPEEPDTTQMPGLPTTWKWARLDAICAIGSGMSVSKNRKHKDPVEVPYLRVANVQRGHLVLDEIKTMEIESDRLTDLSLKKGDILFNEGGDRDKLGRGWIWEGQIAPCITQNHVFRASPYDLEAILPRFLSHWGNTFGQQFFLDEGTQTTNLASINKGVLSSFPVPIPTVDEQHEIVAEVEARITAIDRIEVELDRQINRSHRLRKSTLASAFSGAL